MSDPTEIKRLNYFPGEFLTKADFDAEQFYHQYLRRRHNRVTLGPGVLEGFTVTLSDGKVLVNAGTAIDIQGREIILMPLDPPDPFEVYIPPELAGAMAYISIRYDEKPTDQRRDAGETPGTGGPIPDYIGETRVTESPLIEATAAAPDGTNAILLATCRVDTALNASHLDMAVRQMAPSTIPTIKTPGTFEVQADGMLFNLGSKGSGQLHIVANRNDNRIYLEAFGSDGARSADEMLLTGHHGQPVPKLSLRADLVEASGQLKVAGDIAVDGKHAIRSADGFLRFNQDGAFPGGTHAAYLLSSGSLNVGGALLGTNPWGDPGAGNAVIRRRLTPSAGNAADNGIVFPPDPWGGGGDSAWIRYYTRGGEATTFEIGTSDNPDDHIALMASGNVGIGITAPTAKLHVAGNAKAEGNVEVGGNLSVAGGRVQIDSQGRIGTIGVSPTPRTPGWGGGIHTWDLEADGSIRTSNLIVDGPVNATIIESKANGPTVRLKGTDHAYIEYYPQAGQSRKAYLGFPGAGSTVLAMHNENPSGTVELRSGAFGSHGFLQLDSSGALKTSGAIHAGNSDLYFTKTDHLHSGIGNTAGYAAIENASSHGALMILGRAGAQIPGHTFGTTGRVVKLWDFLEVNGSAQITNDLWIGGDLRVNTNMTIGGTLSLARGLVRIDMEGNLGTHGYSPTPAKTGWGGGIHTFDVEAEGTTWSKAGYQSGPRDLAENYSSTAALSAGDVVSIADAGLIEPSVRPFDPAVMGIVSTAPGMLLGARMESSHEKFPIALSGMVPCKVTDEGGAIRLGDLLTSSSTPGHAMKAKPTMIDGHSFYPPGTIIGKALEPLDAASGVIEVFVFIR